MDKIKKQFLKELPSRKYKVWISSPDNNSFYQEDEFEVTNESYDEIEKIAKNFAFDHVEWGFDEVKDE